MSKRPKLPIDIQTDTLVESRRRCCICFALKHDSDLKQGQIAHLDKIPSNNEPDNLAFLCLAHHDQYDSKTSQSKGFTIDEVKRYRAQLAAFVEKNLPSVGRAANSLPAPVAQVIASPVAVQKSITETRNVENLADHFGLSSSQLERAIADVTTMLERISQAKLTRTHARLLALIINNADAPSIHRRIVESAAGFDYLSREFMDEMIVLEHKGFIELSYEDDEGSAFVRFPRGDYEIWEFIKELSNLSRTSIEALVRQPKLEILF